MMLTNPEAQRPNGVAWMVGSSDIGYIIVKAHTRGKALFAGLSEMEADWPSDIRAVRAKRFDHMRSPDANAAFCREVDSYQGYDETSDW